MDQSRVERSYSATGGLLRRKGNLIIEQELPEEGTPSAPDVRVNPLTGRMHVRQPGEGATPTVKIHTIDALGRRRVLVRGIEVSYAGAQGHVDSGKGALVIVERLEKIQAGH